MISDLTPLDIGGKVYDFSKPYIMGILNITPDSFSDGGNYFDPQKAIDHALRMRDEGADIIDIGGESTRPGSDRVELNEEIRRVIPVIEALSNKLDIPISVDTHKSQVALQALDAGAAIINDITALRGDPEMAAIAASRSIPVIAMHIKGTPKDMQKNPQYDDLIGEIITYFQETLEIAIKAGISKSKLILDPGIGFGKTFDDNFKIINNLSKFNALGLPILIGASRKRFLSENDRYSEDDRLEQSLAVACVSVLNGASFVRVHDVLQTQKALRTISKIQSVS
jgi:dihydropteroate synthase